MLDYVEEDLIPAADVPSLLPKRRGRPVHPKTLARWCREGYGPRKVRLQTVKIGSQVCTTLAAVREFVRQINATAQPSEGQ